MWRDYIGYIETQNLYGVEEKYNCGILRKAKRWWKNGEGC